MLDVWVKESTITKFEVNYHILVSVTTLLLTCALKAHPSQGQVSSLVPSSPSRTLRTGLS